MGVPDTVSANPITPEIEKIIEKIQLIAFDFDGVFTDNMVYTFEDGGEAVRCSRSEGLGLQKLKDLGIEMVVISTEANSVVAARCRKLGLPCIHGCENKLAALMEIAKQKNISLDHVAFVGNDINDIPCLRQAGFPVVVRDAHPDVLEFARFRTIHPGGHGAVREICDLFDAIIRKTRI
jgi:3-deoxy-D-manno-octulosonate 8-phosphate phosphatase (KDO 8-P phosphatase)